MNIIFLFSGKSKKRKQKGCGLIWPLLSTPWVWNIKFPNKGVKSTVLTVSKAGYGCPPPAGSPLRTPAPLAWGPALTGWLSNTLTFAITPSRLSWWNPKLSSKYKTFFMTIYQKKPCENEWNQLFELAISQRVTGFSNMDAGHLTPFGVFRFFPLVPSMKQWE